MNPLTLNPLDFPLHGSRLIEASAGTGKTFTIALLYVRLVLGHVLWCRAPVGPAGRSAIPAGTRLEIPGYRGVYYFFLETIRSCACPAVWSG